MWNIDPFYKALIVKQWSRKSFLKWILYDKLSVKDIESSSETS